MGLPVATVVFDGHIRLNCSILAARKKACYQRGSIKHLRAACPLTSWNCKRKQPKHAHTKATIPRPKATAMEDFIIKETETTKVSVIEESRF
jgi:hypothetical protein